MMYISTAHYAGVCDSFDVALALLDQAEKRFGRSVVIDVNRAYILMDKGDYHEAEKLVRPLAEGENAPTQLKQDLAAILAAQDSKRKKAEALELYNEIRDQIAGNLPVDSIIEVLEEEIE